MSFDYKKMTQLKGDASFRNFYKKNNSIFVYSKKNKKQNLLNYDAINKLLLKNRIAAPKLISEDYNNNFIEISYLGEKTIFDILKSNSKGKLKLYQKVLIILIKLQNIKAKRAKNFLKKYYKIPIYSNNLLFKEADLFLEWYLPIVVNKKKRNKVKKQLKKIIKILIKKINLPNNTFVHRDFHISNIMIRKNKISIIDTQDAVYGNIAYDLVSLIDDVRFKTSKNFKKTIYRNYLKLNKKKFNKKKFKNDFEILSVLRNLKIIGIFTRLAKRDNKKKYLKLIPHAWKLIEDRIDNNDVLIELKKKLDDYFPKKIRIKK